MKVTNVSGAVFTIERGAGATTAAAHSNAAAIKAILAAEDLDQMRQDMSRKGTYTALQAVTDMKAGDRWKLTDSPYSEAYYDGSNWLYFCDGIQMTLPDATGFSWDNQGNASRSLTNGYELVSVTAAGDGPQDISVRYKTAPTAPYTVTACWNPTLNNKGQTVGLIFRDSASGKIMSLAVGHGQGDVNPILFVEYFTSSSAYSSTPATEVPHGVPTIQRIWIRIEDDNTNRKYYASADGITFDEFYSEGRTTQFTADQVGWFIRNYNSGNEFHANLLHWEEA